MSNEENKDKNFEDKSKDEKPKSENKPISIEDKLKDTEDKLLRSLAEIENQRRRAEKEIKEAFDFGGFNFAKETLALLDNLQRAQTSIKNNEDFSDDVKKNAEIDIQELTDSHTNKLDKIFEIKKNEIMTM